MPAHATVADGQALRRLSSGPWSPIKGLVGRGFSGDFSDVLTQAPSRLSSLDVFEKRESLCETLMMWKSEGWLRESEVLDAPSTSESNQKLASPKTNPTNAWKDVLDSQETLPRQTVEAPITGESHEEVSSPKRKPKSNWEEILGSQDTLPRGDVLDTPSTCESHEEMASPKRKPKSVWKEVAGFQDVVHQDGVLNAPISGEPNEELASPKRKPKSAWKETTEAEKPGAAFPENTLNTQATPGAFADEAMAKQTLDARAEQSVEPGRPFSGGQDDFGLVAPSKPSNLRQRLKNSLPSSLMLPTNSLIKPQVPEHTLETTRSTPFRPLQDGETIDSYYELGSEVYAGGALNRVVPGKRRRDGMEVVVKIRAKSKGTTLELSWRAIMDQMCNVRGHRNVLDILEILEDESAFYVVMPKCDGGELLEFLLTEAEVPEVECKRITREILTAVGQLHSKGLVHRDVKPENILFNTESDVGVDPGCSPMTVKLIDFDTCAEWAPHSPKVRHFAGTPGYIAPEALVGEITPLSDLWSVGVILHILMTGVTPWVDGSVVSLEDGEVGSPKARMMYKGMKRQHIDWDDQPWPHFPLARDLCQKLMAFRCEDRLQSAEEALAHPWLS